MVNDDYDIGKAFEAIEDELIASMIRNLQRHKAWEDAEGFRWSQWQAEQLKSLAKYRQTNQKKFGKQFNGLNSKIEALIRIAHDEGGMAQEAAILEAIKDGFKGAKKISKGATAEFFKLNDRKLDALIKATTDDMQRAETAVLRMANDQYRKVIYNAQVYANTGAGTYEKAVDMATKDMLSSGLNCVMYANGARHTLADYADMAIRTASKRAYLQGEGAKRQEWGISTVVMNKRGNPCPKCLPWVDKVLIDDVWSGGSRKDGNYPLMSTAIASGLYHPRCKDSHTTYFEDISTPPDDKFTKEELSEIEQGAKQDAKLKYAERQAEKYGRLAKYSLDESNRRQYQNKTGLWQSKENYKIQSYGLETDISNELNILNSTLDILPLKVKAVLKDTTFNLGQIGASQYDYEHDILYIAKGADKTAVIHEVGHAVENKVLDKSKVSALRKHIVGNVSPFDIHVETYYDAADNPVDIFVLNREEFVSEYQGRIYIEDIFKAFDKDGKFNDELLGEFVSEAFREYIENRDNLKENHKDLFDLISEAIE